MEGKLSIGSPTCRLYSNIEIELFGSKEELNFEVVSFLEDISKGVVTKNGGEVRLGATAEQNKWNHSIRSSAFFIYIYFKRQYPVFSF